MAFTSPEESHTIADWWLDKMDKEIILNLKEFNAELALREKELCEEVDKMKFNYPQEKPKLKGAPAAKVAGFNQALDQVISLISKKRK